MKTFREYLEAVYNENDSWDSDPHLTKFKDAVLLSDRKIKQNEISVEGSPKGNWVVYRNNKKIMTVDGSLLDDKTIEKHELRYHGLEQDK